MSNSSDTSPNPPPLPAGERTPRREPFCRSASRKKRYLVLILLSLIGGVVWPWLVLAVGAWPQRDAVEFEEYRVSSGWRSTLSQFGVPESENFGDSSGLCSTLSQLGVAEYSTPIEGRGYRSVAINPDEPHRVEYSTADLDGDFTLDFMLVRSEDQAFDQTEKCMRFEYRLFFSDGVGVTQIASFYLGSYEFPETVWQYLDIGLDGCIDARSAEKGKGYAFDSGDILFDHEWIPVTIEAGPDGKNLCLETNGARVFCWEEGEWRVLNQP
jgi:hypothetical protein